MGEGPEFDMLNAGARFGSSATLSGSSLGAVHRAQSLVGHTLLVDQVDAVERFQGQTMSNKSAEQIGAGPALDVVRTIPNKITAD